MSPTASDLPSSTSSHRPSSARNVPPPNQLTDPSSIKPSKSSPKPSSPAPAPAKPVHYTLILRFPFPRNGFQDPVPVTWDATKDKALWKIISKASNSKDLDWEAIAERFEVALSFLMRQAAWLYERHFEGMRVQMRRLATGAPSNVVEASSSASKETRVPSATGTRKDSPLPPGDVPSPKSAVAAPAFSRTPSTTTITQSRLGGGPSGLRQRALRTSGGSQRRPGTPKNRTQDDDGGAIDPDEDDGDDATESDEEPIMTRSQAFRRPPLGGAASKPTLGTLSSEGDEISSEDDPSSSGGYLPFAAAAIGTGSGGREPDPAATLRGQSPRRGAGTQRGSSKQRHPVAARHDSSTSASASSASASTSNVQPARPGPLSPRHRAQLTAMSPHSRRIQGGEGSEGTPSMGSSFSDLDDASVTQSALEDALMSNLQAGGGSIASRMSSLGRAFGGSTRREG